VTEGLRPLRADGPRVWVSSATDRDVEAYARAMELSRRRLSEWNPVDPHGLPSLIGAASRYHRTLLLHARSPEGDHDLVGKVNVTNVVLGRAMTGTLGYDAFDPYAGRGLFGEGLGLAVDLAFAPSPRGMGLHRLEANVQPGNVRSAAVLRRLGFRREGFSPAYLLMPGPASEAGRDAWRDHDRYAVTVGEWPAPAFAPPRPHRLAVLVNGVRGSGRTSLARRLAAELGLPLLDESVVDAHALKALLADAPSGAVLAAQVGDEHRRGFAEDLQRRRLDPAPLVEVRYGIGGAAHSAAIGLVLEVDTSREISDRDVVLLALRARAASQ
jgi:ribosomal-protein-alanine N-acetyltransferase